jgi:hypothetical protein
LKATTISYPDWKRRVDQGKYQDVTKTKWWQAFDLLAGSPPLARVRQPDPQPHSDRWYR